MDLALIATIIGSAIGVVSLVYAFMRNFKTDVNNHIDALRQEMRDENSKMDQRVMETNKRMDAIYHQIDQRVMEANKRMDGVYHLLLKKLENSQV